MTIVVDHPLEACHVDLVYAAALRQVRDAEAARDITQAVFLLLARKRAAGRGPAEGRLVGWLLVVTGYTVKAWRRAVRRRGFHERRAPAAGVSSGDAMVTDDARRVLEQLDAALRELPALDREVLSRRYLEDQPVAAIGAAVALSENGAGKRIARALEKLRHLLARRGVRTLAAPALVALLIEQSRVHAAALPAVPSDTVQMLAKAVEGRLSVVKMTVMTTLATAAVVGGVLAAGAHLHVFAAGPAGTVQAAVPRVPAASVAAATAPAAATPSAGNPITVYAYDPKYHSYETGTCGPMPGEVQLHYGVAAQIGADHLVNITGDSSTTDTLALDITTLSWDDPAAVRAAVEEKLVPLTHPHLTVLITSPAPTDDQLKLLWSIVFDHANGQGQRALVLLGKTTLTLKPGGQLAPSTAPAPPEG